MTRFSVSEVHADASERAQLSAVCALVRGSPDRVRVQVGAEETELPQSLVRVILAAAGSLLDGETVAIVSEEGEVSPSEAAKLLGVSRQYVDRLLAEELLPSRRLPNSAYRRIPVRDVLAYRTTHERKRAGIRQIVEAATAAGLKY